VPGLDEDEDQPHADSPPRSDNNWRAPGGGLASACWHVRPRRIAGRSGGHRASWPAPVSCPSE
jgi:hypothetical protein